MMNLARNSDPITSHLAAARVHEFAGTHYEKIIAYLASEQSARGAEQIGDALGIEPYAIRKRLSEMERWLEVEAVGLRKTRSGRMERTWKLTHDDFPIPGNGGW